jgi:hypothetical protein
MAAVGYLADVLLGGRRGGDSDVGDVGHARRPRARRSTAASCSCFLGLLITRRRPTVAVHSPATPTTPHALSLNVRRRLALPALEPLYMYATASARLQPASYGLAHAMPWLGGYYYGLLVLALTVITRVAAYSEPWICPATYERHSCRHKLTSGTHITCY